MKLILHHPFEHFDELLSVDGVAYPSYKDAFADCCQYHSHPEDYYVDPEPDEDDLPDDDDDPDDVGVGPDSEVEVPLVDFEAYARRQPDHDSVQLDGLDSLKTHHMDCVYDWSPYAEKYILDCEGWDQL